MSQEFYTVDDVAIRLALHPKTVLRLISSGRLRATKIGKSYRVTRSDMEAFAGAPPDQMNKSVRVTTILDVPDVDRERSDRLTKAMHAVLLSRSGHFQPTHMEIVFDPTNKHLKIIIVGSSTDTIKLIGAFETFWGSAA